MRYLGSLVIPAGQTIGNHDTATPFSLAGYAKIVPVMQGGAPPASTALETADYSTFKTSATGVALSAVNQTAVVLPPIGMQQKGDQSTVSVYNGSVGAITVLIYGVYPESVRTLTAV